ncbi:hypothetical protein CPB84DRAFT_1744153 [Gymnopilus junonius]|uniref:GAG-pre-integrase domain-containing protein n=1 Tax=Gymnopilus junonius TaxID=109634 RepID=A0A9P5NXA7_GYMJU|nr:hypothetical protein CPB84DRAFT_1744153 [Gymnopilus junonius]
MADNGDSDSTQRSSVSTPNLASLYDLDATHPSVPLLGSFTSFDKEKLDKEKANWNSWSRDMYLMMSLNRSYNYVTGDAVAPDTLLKPRALRNWNSNDWSTCAFLSSAISDAEWKALSDPPCSNAKAYWEKLKAHHSSDGPVVQVYLLKQAMNIVITSPLESITKTIDKAADLEHEAIQFQLQDHLQQATPQSPFSFTQIQAFLEDKQHLIDVNKCQNNPTSTPSSVALSMQEIINILLCSNCRKCGHKDKYCISQGGGIAGKMIEELKMQHRLDREASKMKSKTLATSSQKVCIPYKDANGQALILKVDVNIFQAAPVSNPTPFVGIASTLIEPYSMETLEMEGWMATYDMWDLPKINLPSVPITSEDFALSASTQASIGFQMIDTMLFKIYSGASAPISPIQLGGIVVKAIGIGNIVIHQAPGCTLILYNALHIPDASVHLVSISALWHYSQQKVNFDGPTYNVTFDGKVVGTSTLNAKTGLYDLDVPPINASAYAVTAPTMLETWHHCLGHTNYQCIQHMARNGMVKDENFGT